MHKEKEWNSFVDAYFICQNSFFAQRFVIYSKFAFSHKIFYIFHSCFHYAGNSFYFLQTKWICNVNFWNNKKQDLKKYAVEQNRHRLYIYTYITSIHGKTNLPIMLLINRAPSTCWHEYECSCAHFISFQKWYDFIGWGLGAFWAGRKTKPWAK